MMTKTASWPENKFPPNRFLSAEEESTCCHDVEEGPSWVLSCVNSYLGIVYNILPDDEKIRK